MPSTHSCARAVTSHSTQPEVNVLLRVALAAAAAKQPPKPPHVQLLLLPSADFQLAPLSVQGAVTGFTVRIEFCGLVNDPVNSLKVAPLSKVPAAMLLRSNCTSPYPTFVALWVAVTETVNDVELP